MKFFSLFSTDSVFRFGTFLPFRFLLVFWKAFFGSLVVPLYCVTFCMCSRHDTHQKKVKIYYIWQSANSLARKKHTSKIQHHSEGEGEGDIKKYYCFSAIVALQYRNFSFVYASTPLSNDGTLLWHPKASFLIFSSFSLLILSFLMMKLKNY